MHIDPCGFLSNGAYAQIHRWVISGPLNIASLKHTPLLKRKTYHIHQILDCCWYPIVSHCIPSKQYTWVISHVPMFHITQALDSMIGIWSTRWLLFQVMSNIPKSWDIYQLVGWKRFPNPMGPIIIPSKPGRIKSPFSQSINQGIFNGTFTNPWSWDIYQPLVKHMVDMLICYILYIYIPTIYIYMYITNICCF